MALLIAFVIALTIVGRAYPHHRAAHWRPAPVWLKQALCVHRHEGSWRDPDAPYYGGMQFALSTWKRAGGRGYPHHATVREQLYRSWVIWRKNGGRWNEWPTYARYCA
jgi:hypothetical protein